MINSSRRQIYVGNKDKGEKTQGAACQGHILCFPYINNLPTLGILYLAGIIIIIIIIVVIIIIIIITIIIIVWPNTHSYLNVQNEADLLRILCYVIESSYIVKYLSQKLSVYNLFLPKKRILSNQGNLSLANQCSND